MKRIALISFPLALVIAAACQEGVVNPTDDVPEPRFAKWTSGFDGCDVIYGAVKFQLRKAGSELMVTGTSEPDYVECDDVPSTVDITFSGGDGDDIFLGGDGDDHMVGGNGNDYFHGGLGDDTAVGGEGTDTCFTETTISCELPV